MSAEYSKEETITLLRELNGLLTERANTEYDIEKGLVHETLEELEPITTKARDLEFVPSAFNNLPIFPKYDKKKLSVLKQKVELKKKIVLICIPIIIISFILYNFMNSAFAFILFMASAITAVVIPLTNTTKSEYEDLKKEADKENELFQKTMAAFKKSAVSYEEERLTGIQVATKQYEIYLEQMLLHEKAIVAYTMKIEELKAHYEEIEVMLCADKFSFITNTYRHLAGSILELLESGRADTFKEALNLAIKEEREEDERYERRRHEEEMQYITREDAENKRLHYEQMQEEAHKQTKLAASQAAEAERHNRQMEYETKRHNTAMENAMRR